MATPPFLPGMVPQGAPPPGTPAQGQQPPDAMQEVLKILMKGAQPQGHLASPTAPAPVPSGGHPQTLVGKHTGSANLGNMIGSTIQSAISYEKKKKLAAATSDWNDLLTATQKYITPEGKVDEKAYQDPAVMQILGDPKKLKLMAKSLNQDWLNPKPDVYADARKIAVDQHQKKQQAAQGLQGTIKEILGRIRGQGKQPPLSPDQQQAMAKDVMSRAPIQQGTTDVKQSADSMRAFADVQKAQADLTRAQTDAKDKYQIQPTANGGIVAIDKNDPTKVIEVTDEKGRPITAAPKGVQSGGKVAMVNGIPIGITKSINGKNTTITPGDPNWTGDDAKLFQAATGATAASNASKDHRVQLAAQWRAQSLAQTREYPVMNTETGTEEMVSADVINAAPKGTYAPATGASKVMSQKAIFDEIDYTSGQLSQAIDEMGDAGFDAKARAQIASVLRDTDPRSAWSSFLNSDVAATLTDPQIKYVTSLVSMDESAMSLRSIAGQGQSSDSMRSRITAMLPGAGTPSAKYAKRQMQLFQGELRQLRKGVPNLGTKAVNQDDPLGILN